MTGPPAHRPVAGRYGDGEGGKFMSMTSAQVRAQVTHPVIDADGHFVELAPLLHDEILANLEVIGGAALR